MPEDRQLNEPRWWIPWRRTARLSFSGPGEIADWIQPTVDAAQLHLAGRPGWRGCTFTTTRTPAAGMRSCILLRGNGGPFRVDFLYSDDDVRIVIGSTPTLAALLSTVAAISATPGINRSGEPGIDPNQDAGCSVVLEVADVDNPPAGGLLVSPMTGLYPYPTTSPFEVPRGQSMLVYAETDDEARRFTGGLTEFRDWTA